MQVALSSQTQGHVKIRRFRFAPTREPIGTGHDLSARDKPFERACSKVEPNYSLCVFYNQSLIANLITLAFHFRASCFMWQETVKCDSSVNWNIAVVRQIF